VKHYTESEHGVGNYKGTPASCHNFMNLYLQTPKMKSKFIPTLTFLLYCHSLRARCKRH